MTRITTRGGRRVLRLASLRPDGTAVIDVGTDGPPRHVGEGVYVVRLADLCGPSPDWSTTVARLAHTLRIARSLTRAGCPLSRLIAVATVRRAVAGLRELTGRPKRSPAAV